MASGAASNWRQALSALKSRTMPLSADLLVHIGCALGESVAWDVYRALHEPPRDANGEAVDWLVIRSRILALARS